MQRFLVENPGKQRLRLRFHTNKEKPLASVNWGYIVLKQGQPLLSETDKGKRKMGNLKSPPLLSKANAVSVRFVL